MPVHVRMHQVLTVALLDKDVNGSDEIGRCGPISNWLPISMSVLQRTNAESWNSDECPNASPGARVSACDCTLVVGCSPGLEHTSVIMQSFAAGDTTISVS